MITVEGAAEQVTYSKGKSGRVERNKAAEGYSAAVEKKRDDRRAQKPKRDAQKASFRTVGGSGWGAV